MGSSGNKTPEGYNQYQVQSFTPEQMQLFSQMFSNVGPDSYLGKLAGGDQSAFAEQEAPALRQFSALQGGMASRFSGMGTGGRKSSGFQNTMNQASSDFAQDLQSKRMKTRMDALRELMGFSNQLLGQKPYESGLVAEAQEPPGFAESFAGGMGAAIPGAIAGFATGGLPGAAVGGATGFAGGAQTTRTGGINTSMF
jgi:hypothetical protein